MPCKLILTAALAASVLSGVASAAPPPPPPPHAGRGPMRADADGDQIVTRQEAIAEATRRFDRLDRNRDGRLDAAEAALRGPRQRGPRGNDLPPPPPPADGE